MPTIADSTCSHPPPERRLGRLVEVARRPARGATSALVGRTHQLGRPSCIWTRWPRRVHMP
eukprot:9968363-Alexandrium_andersonii.AAC.1